MLWGNMWNYLAESFTEEESLVLSRYFTNLDKPVFALINLPEVVKGALFARYSRSAKSLRRLFLDEFYNPADFAVNPVGEVGLQRAERLYERMLSEYGDDSVAQLGGVHLACEQASNILTKVLERGRLMAYLEQSTRYVPYDKPMADGQFKYFVPDEVVRAGLESEFRATVDHLFAGYRELFEEVQQSVYATTYKEAQDSDFIYNSSVRAVALDAVRGVLPAAVLSNVGIYGSAQAYEMLIMRMRSSRLAEVREYAELIKQELDKVIPAFLTRLDRSDRGGVWVDYLATRSGSLDGLTFELATKEAQTAVSYGQVDSRDGDGTAVRLIRYQTGGERDVAAGILFELGRFEMSDAVKVAADLSESELCDLFTRYVGNRENRRHKPGRAFEQTSYLFEVECDYGAFRDLQRHRILSIEWQDLGVSLGYSIPELISDFGLEEEYTGLLERARTLYDHMLPILGTKVSSYAVPMGYRIRFLLEINAREAMHLIELRSSPQGHSEYRKVAQKMFECIANIANHRNIARSMVFVDLDQYRLGRLSSLRREERKIQDPSN